MAGTRFFSGNDLRQAARSLGKSPTLVAVATLSLGLGVGVNTTLYSFFHTVFLEPPTARKPDRLVRIEPGNSNQVSYPNFLDLHSGGTFEGLAAYAVTRLNLRSGNDLEKVTGMMVSPTFFEVLGAMPYRGRVWSPVDESGAIVTHEFWEKHFGGRTDIAGALLNLNGQQFVVIGILPPDFRAITGAMGPDVYLPITPALVPGVKNRNEDFLTLFGRVRAGVTQGQAQAVITSQNRALERMYPAENIDLGRATFLFPVHGLGSWRARHTSSASVMAISAIPFVIFGLVLLIACANVAGLLLARGAARQREIAIRLAIGATRSRLVGSLLAESLILSTVGSLAGLLMTIWLCALAGSITLPDAPAPLHVRPDLSLLAYAALLALITTLACGLTPAMAASRPHLTEALKQDARSSVRRLTGRNLMVAGQVALSTLLLFVSTLFLRSLAYIGNVDPGFNLDHVLTAHVDLDKNRYPVGQRLQFAAQATETVQAIPGVLTASVTNLIPLGGDVYSTKYQVEGKTVPRIETYQMNVGPNYFRTMETRLRRGREFTLADRTGAPVVVIVNEAFVRAHALDGGALGAHVRSNDTEPWMEIVGVVANSKYAFFGETPRPILYRSFQQAGGNLFVIARTAGTPGSAIGALQNALSSIDRSTVIEPRTIREATSLEASIRRIGAWILGSIGALGLSLALLGLYGVMAYNVNRRAREIGIRMALGASRPAILRMILGKGLLLVGTGAGVGTLLSLVAARPLAFLMSGIPTSDPRTIGMTLAVLLATGIAASYVPARRAAQVDPMVVLRYD